MWKWSNKKVRRFLLPFCSWKKRDPIKVPVVAVIVLLCGHPTSNQPSCFVNEWICVSSTLQWQLPMNWFLHCGYLHKNCHVGGLKNFYVFGIDFTKLNYTFPWLIWNSSGIKLHQQNFHSSSFFCFCWLFYGLTQPCQER